MQYWQYQTAIDTFGIHEQEADKNGSPWSLGKNRREESREKNSLKNILRMIADG